MENKKERTLVLIKPDAVQRSLIGEIVSRFEKVGLKIIGMKFFIPKKEQIEKQYGDSKQEIEAMGKRSIDSQLKKYGRKIDITSYEQGVMILEKLKRFMSAGPIVGMVLEGHQAVAIVDKLVGATEPLSSDVGTIRGDFTLDSYWMADNDNRAVRNLIHRSGSLQEAEKEIKIWFKDDELVDYKLISERILYDVDLNGILE